jgi:hypothetical protein
MTSPNYGIPLACEPQGIPSADRQGHFALLDRLFRELSLGRVTSPDGYSYRFDPSAFELIASFVKNERKCCPFLNFSIEVRALGAPVWLRITGPDGTREFLDSELPSIAT